MKDKQIEKILPLLVGGETKSYDLKADGLLVVIDSQGRKCFFNPEAYRGLLADHAKPAKPDKTPLLPAPVKKPAAPRKPKKAEGVS